MVMSHAQFRDAIKANDPILSQVISANSRAPARLAGPQPARPLYADPSPPSAGDLKESPDARQSLEHGRPKILERDAGAGYKVAHGSGDPNLPPST
jgi:hypothetical protein